jgi:nitrogen regulatory protein P-II 1
MKLVTAVVKPFKLDEVKVAVKALGVNGMTVSQVRGFGRTGSHIEIYRGKEYEFDFVDKIRIEIACTDEAADKICDTIVDAAKTEIHGDGKVWISDIEHVVRIRTGERGPDAVK